MLTRVLWKALEQAEPLKVKTCWESPQALGVCYEVLFVRTFRDSCDF